MAPDDIPNEQLRFGNFELDPNARELYRSGQPVHVQPRVFALIHYLAAHPGRALSREELLETLWGDTVVADGSLSRAVRAARCALRTDTSLADPIQTVRRHGYRFSAPVERDSPPPRLARDDVRRSGLQNRVVSRSVAAISRGTKRLRRLDWTGALAEQAGSTCSALADQS